MLKFFFLTLLATSPSWAATILDVREKEEGVLVLVQTTSQRASWDRGTELCLRDSEREQMSCGKVAALGKTTLAIQMKKNGGWNKGDTVEIYVDSKDASRTTSSLENVTTQEAAPKLTSNEIGVGGAGGFSYLLFQAKYERRLAPHFSVGLKPSFAFNNGVDSSTSAIGADLTMQYFLSPFPFGFYGEVGAGLVSVKAVTGTVTDTALPLTFSVLGGWRGKVVRSGVTFGIGAGMKYVASGATGVVVGFSGFMPLFMAEVGYRF